VTKHLKVLQRAGLITRGRQAQWRPSRIDARALRVAPIGWNPIAASGKRSSTASTTICAICKRGTMNDVIIKRTIAAPRELVYAAFTDARHLANGGPEGFTTPDAAADPRPGGAMRLDMHGPDGNVYLGGGTYHELTPPNGSCFRQRSRGRRNGASRVSQYAHVRRARRQNGADAEYHHGSRRSVRRAPHRRHGGRLDVEPRVPCGVSRALNCHDDGRGVRRIDELQPGCSIEQ